MFSIPIMKIAELECIHKDIYVYRFAYKGPLGQHMDAPVIPGREHVSIILCTKIYHIHIFFLILKNVIDL